MVVGVGTILNYAYGNPVGLALGLYRKGVFEQIPEREYVATNEANLRALRTAMLLYHDAEDQFPVASGWMDAIKISLRTNDLKDGEELKKLSRPGAAAGEYGYAINGAIGGKYKGDVLPSTVLIFESVSQAYNAVGDPAKDGSGKGITLDGKIVSVRE